MQKSRDSAVFIHPLSDVQAKNIGEATKIWQFAIILSQAIIGKNCNINSHTFIENDVILGDNVTVKCGVYLWDGIRIEDNVFIGPNTTFTNDKFPKPKQLPAKFQTITIKKSASIGANVTILENVIIGENSMIGAGSLVTKDIPADELWMGNPAKFIRKL